MTHVFRYLPAIALVIAAAPAQACPTGKPVEIEWNGGQYAGMVLDGPDGQGNCLVSYDGYDASWNEWVGRDRMSLPAPPVSCPVGAALEIEWNGAYWAGSVLQGPNAEGQCYVSYDGYDASWDEWVAPSRLRMAAAVVGCPVGTPLEIEWNGSWWDGSVLEGPNAQGQCLVTYEGWDASWNEWVTADRLRGAN